MSELIQPRSGELLSPTPIEIGSKEGYCPSCHGSKLMDAFMPILDPRGNNIGEQKVEGWCHVCGGSGRVKIVTYLEPIPRD